MTFQNLEVLLALHGGYLELLVIKLIKDKKIRP